MAGETVATESGKEAYNGTEPATTILDVGPDGRGGPAVRCVDRQEIGTDRPCDRDLTLTDDIYVCVERGSEELCRGVQGEGPRSRRDSWHALHARFALSLYDPRNV